MSTAIPGAAGSSFVQPASSEQVSNDNHAGVHVSGSMEQLMDSQLLPNLDNILSELASQVQA